MLSTQIRLDMIIDCDLTWKAQFPVQMHMYLVFMFQ